MPHLAMLIAMAFGASSFTAGKAAVDVLPASEVLAVRFVLGASILWLVLVAMRARLRPDRYDAHAFLVGLGEPGVGSVLAFWGLTLTTAVHATVIFAWAPLLQAVLARLVLKERLIPEVIVGSVLALVGTAWLVGDRFDSGDGSLLGDTMCLVGLLLMSGAQLVLRRVAQARGRPIAAAAWQLTGSAAAAIAASLLIEWPFLGIAWHAPADPEIWLVILYLAVFVTAAVFALTNYSLRHLPVGLAGLYYVLLVPFGVPIAVIFLGETVTAGDLAAIVLIALGVALPSLSGVPAIADRWRRGRA
jgi:drug/metabolite transporter (DMT)-like permease